MSQISLKSLSGITSITTPAGVDNQLTVHTNDTTEVFKVTSSGLNVTGVITASSFSGIDTDKISEGNTEAEVVDTGSDGHFKVKTEGSERLRIDSAGNMGLGITPDTQGGTVDSLQIGSATNLYNETSDDYTILGNNVYFDGTNNKYIKAQESSRLIQNAGEFSFQQAASGSADANITYTTPLKINSSGKFGFGTNSPYTHGIATFNDSNGIVLEGSSQGRLLFRHTGGGTNLKMFDIQSSNGIMKFRTIADNGTTVTERLTITAAGTVTASGTFESTGTGAGVGGKFGQISVGAGGVYNTIQNTVANTPIHLQYNNTGDVRVNEGGGDMQTRDIYPETNNSYSLGTNAKRWANIHTNDLNLSNEGSKNDVDGTWGQYTIQEGENDLFLINKRNGKKFKFLLQEVN